VGKYIEMKGHWGAKFLTEIFFKFFREHLLSIASAVFIAIYFQKRRYESLHRSMTQYFRMCDIFEGSKSFSK